MRTSQIDIALPADWRARATVSVEQAGRIVGVGRSAAYTAVSSGDLPVIRVGRKLLVPVCRLRQLLGELPENDNGPAGNRAEVTTEDTHDVQSAA